MMGTPSLVHLLLQGLIFQVPGVLTSGVKMQPVDWPREYGWENGVPVWAADRANVNPDFIIGPLPAPAFYLEPESDLDNVTCEEVRPGKNGPRASEEPESIDSRVYKLIRESEGLCAVEIGRRCGTTRKIANAALYRLEARGLALKYGNNKPVIWFNTTTSPADWLSTVRDMQPELDHISDARPENITKSGPTTKTRWGRAKISVGDKTESADLSLDRRGEDNVLSGYDTHVMDALGEQHTKGDTSFLAERVEKELRGGELTVDFDCGNRHCDKDIRRLQEKEAIFALEETGLEGARAEPHQAWNLLSEETEHGKIQGTHIAAPTVGNGIAAACQRHFKLNSGVGVMTPEGQKSVNYAAAKVVAHLQQHACDHGRISEVFDILSVQPEIMKSGKWSKQRFLDGLRRAGVKVGNDLPQRSFSVKPNEALGKKKARGIISAGDEGVILHIFDSAVFERLLFGNPLYEGRSIKHANMREYGCRIGNFVRSYAYTASTDFGAFDGSCTRGIRDSIENMILKKLFSTVLGDSEEVVALLREALRDRTKDSCKMRLGACVKFYIENMIRESGDRGTSILNFLTNYVMHIGAAHFMLTQAGIKSAAVDVIVEGAIRSGELLNIMCEGDDGLMGFTKKYVEIVAQGDKQKFGQMLVSAYAHFGFKLEPQGPNGEVSAGSALLSSAERNEFCSKIFVCVAEGTYLYPKPSKFFQSLRVSFDIASEAATAGVTKAVSLMATAVHNPVLYSMARSLMQYWTDKGGILEVEELNEHSLNAKSLIVVAKTVVDTRGTFENLIGWLDNEHFMAMSDGEAANAVMDSFSMETGISKDEQESLIVELSGGKSLELLRKVILSCA